MMVESGQVFRGGLQLRAQQIQAVVPGNNGPVEVVAGGGPLPEALSPEPGRPGQGQQAHQRAPEPGRHRTPQGFQAAGVMVAAVACQDFIPAVAGQGHGHLAAGQAGHDPGGDGRGVGKRLVELPHHLRKESQDIGAHHLLSMFRAKTEGHLPGPGEFAGLSFRKTDGEGAKRSGAQAVHLPHHHGGIQPPEEKAPRGTSLTRRRRTASVSSASNSSCQVLSDSSGSTAAGCQ